MSVLGIYRDDVTDRYAPNGKDIETNVELKVFRVPHRKYLNSKAQKNLLSM